MFIYFERCGPIERFTTVEGPFRAKKGAYVVAGLSGSGKTAIAHCLYAIRRRLLGESEGLDPLFWPEYARIELERHEVRLGANNVVEIFCEEVKGPREVGRAIIAMPHEYLLSLYYTRARSVKELSERWPWPRPTVVVSEETIPGLTEGYIEGRLREEIYHVPLSEGEFMEEITQLYVEIAEKEARRLRELGFTITPLVWLDDVFGPMHGEKAVEIVKRYEEADVALYVTTHRIEAVTRENTYIITYGLGKLSKKFNVLKDLRSVLCPETSIEPESEEWREVFEKLVGLEYAEGKG